MQVLSNQTGTSRHIVVPMDVIDQLHDAVKASGMPKKTVAHLAHLSAWELSRLLNHKLENPNIRDIEAVAAVIGVPMAALYGGGGPAPEVDLKRTRDAMRAITEFVDRHDPGMQATSPPRITAVAKPPARKRATSRTAKPFRAAATPNVVLFDDTELKRVTIPRAPWKRGAKHAARAVGDSMIGAGIEDGALVFFRRTGNIRAALEKIVICRVNGSVYLKRFGYEDGRIVLRSENERHQPIRVKDGDEVELYGIVLSHPK